MNMKGKATSLSDGEIDRTVIAEADDDSAWQRPIHVRKARQTSLSLPSELAARAAFFARLHREANVGNWLKRIIRERVDMEEAALAGLKRDLSGKEK